MLNLPPKLKAEPELIEKWSLLSVNSTSLQREPFSIGGHAGIRTQGPILKRDVLYRLSYVTSGNNICWFYPRALRHTDSTPGFHRKGLQRYAFFFNRQIFSPRSSLEVALRRFPPQLFPLRSKGGGEKPHSILPASPSKSTRAIQPMSPRCLANALTP